VKAFWIAAQSHWFALSQREQRWVMAAALTVLLGLVWWVAIEPALTGRARLSQLQPGLRLQASELAGLAAQGGIRRTVNNTDLLGSLSAGLITAGFDAQAAEAINQERVRVRLNSVDYSDIVGWLAATQALGDVRLESASITLLEPGRVNAELLFQRKTN
jgi:type II secretory pathway component PulM